VRKGICVPMIALCLLLCSCGGKATGETAAETIRQPYLDMTGCSMEAEVSVGAGSEYAAEFTLRCEYLPEGSSEVEILAPESVAGIRASVSGEAMELLYEDIVLPMGTLSNERLSPAACLLQLMESLRSGWLLAENKETVGEADCLRLTLDQTGTEGNKIVSDLWLERESGVPVLGEISVDEEIILRARFTKFKFHDTINNQE